MLWRLLSTLREKAKNKSCLDPYPKFFLSFWESCKSTTTLVSFRSLMITEARRLSLSSSAESTSVESFLLDTTSYSLISRSGLITFCHPDSSAISSSQPPKESSLTRNAEKDTSEERSSDFSIEQWSVRYLTNKFIF